MNLSSTKIPPVPFHCIKSKSRMNYRITFETRNHKTPGRNQAVNFFTLVLTLDFLGMFPQAKATKGKIKEGGLYRTK